MSKHLLKISLFSLFIILSTAIAGYSQVKLLNTPPRNYVCYKTADSIVPDGIMNEASWKQVPWTDDFLDIEGPHMDKPLHRTRAKMLWDDEYLYIAAELEEPHLWATFTERESIIFHENNFEVFIDPSGDTHHYYELEINALGTIWDLLLTKPYRNGGLPISAWDIRGFKYGIQLKGTLNDPSDVDEGWTIEMALPWRILAEAAPGKRKPESGDQWRINFSRVQWRLDTKDETYQKTINPETGRPFPEFNWVWSPQWAINMHMPEYWGYIQFEDTPAGEATVPFSIQEYTEEKYLIRELYYMQHRYKSENGTFAENLNDLEAEHSHLFEKYDIVFDSARNSFEVSLKAINSNIYWHVSDDSKLWKSVKNENP